MQAPTSDHSLITATDDGRHYRVRNYRFNEEVANSAALVPMNLFPAGTILREVYALPESDTLLFVTRDMRMILFSSTEGTTILETAPPQGVISYTVTVRQKGRCYIALYAPTGIHLYQVTSNEIIPTGVLSYPARAQNLLVAACSRYLAVSCTADKQTSVSIYLIENPDVMIASATSDRIKSLAFSEIDQPANSDIKEPTIKLVLLLKDKGNSYWRQVFPFTYIDASTPPAVETGVEVERCGYKRITYLSSFLKMEVVDAAAVVSPMGAVVSPPRATRRNSMTGNSPIDSARSSRRLSGRMSGRLSGRMSGRMSGRLSGRMSRRLSTVGVDMSNRVDAYIPTMDSSDRHNKALVYASPDSQYLFIAQKNLKSICVFKNFVPLTTFSLPGFCADATFKHIAIDAASQSLFAVLSPSGRNPQNQLITMSIPNPEFGMNVRPDPGHPTTFDNGLYDMKSHCSPATRPVCGILDVIADFTLPKTPFAEDVGHQTAAFFYHDSTVLYSFEQGIRYTAAPVTLEGIYSFDRSCLVRAHSRFANQSMDPWTYDPNAPAYRLESLTFVPESDMSETNQVTLVIQAMRLAAGSGSGMANYGEDQDSEDAMPHAQNVVPALDLGDTHPEDLVRVTLQLTAYPGLGKVSEEMGPDGEIHDELEEEAPEDEEEIMAAVRPAEMMSPAQNYDQYPQKNVYPIAAGTEMSDEWLAKQGSNVEVRERIVEVVKKVPKESVPQKEICIGDSEMIDLDGPNPYAKQPPKPVVKSSCVQTSFASMALDDGSMPYGKGAADNTQDAKQAMNPLVLAVIGCSIVIAALLVK